MKKIFLIAGEASGDELGAKLMKAFISESVDEVKFFGVGGKRMEELGLKSLFPITELSLIGFAEIIPHIPNLLNRINQTVEKILLIKPDVVVTIDAPGFNFRVAKKLRKSEIKLVHYVAPTVWAYKPKRAEKISKLYDHLLVLLPFEPPYFEKVGLSCTFIGHPIMEEDIVGGDGKAFRKKHDISQDTPLLCVMPGSRNSELARLIPVFSKTVNMLKKDFPNLRAVVIAASNFAEKLTDEVKGWKVKTVVISSKDEKKNALAACNVALAKSGTVTLEPAIAGVPMVIAYKVNPISAWMLRRMLKVQYVNLVNIIMKKEVIPEFLQESCTSEKIAEQLKILLIDEEIRKKQINGTKKALEQLRSKQPASITAAKSIALLL